MPGNSRWIEEEDDAIAFALYDIYVRGEALTANNMLDKSQTT